MRARCRYVVGKPWRAAEQMGALQRELQQLEERLDRLLSGSSVIVTIDTLLAQLQELAASTPSATSAAVAVASADHAAAAAHPASILDTASLAAAASSAVPRTPFARFGATAPVATNPALPVMLHALRSDAQSVILDLRQQMVTKRREIKALFARSSSLKCVRPLRPTPLRRARLARAASCVADAARCARRGNVLTPRLPVRCLRPALSGTSCSHSLFGAVATRPTRARRWRPCTTMRTPETRRQRTGRGSASTTDASRKVRFLFYVPLRLYANHAHNLTRSP